MNKSITDRIFLFSIISLHLIFFLWQIFHANYFLKDSYEYLQAAANLKTDFILYCGDLSKPLNFELFTKRPPLYPIFLAVCQLVSANLIFLLIIQNVLSITGIYIVRRLLIDYGYSTKYDVLFIILLLFTHAQFIYANLIMSETLLQFLIILLVWNFIKYMNGGNHLYGLWYSLLLTLCVFTKPVFVFFVFLNFLLFVWISYKKATVKPLLFCLIPLVLLFTYQYRNYKLTGVFETSSIATINMLDYNAYQFLVNTEGLPAADKAIARIDSLSGLKNTYKETAEFNQQQAMAIVMKHPVSYALFHLKGVAGFFLDPGRFDLVNFFNLRFEKTNGLLYQINQSGLRGAFAFMLKHSLTLLVFLVMIGLLNVFKLVSFTLLIFKPGNKNLAMGFVIGLVVYVALLTGPLGASRFMMPLAPLYIGCGLLFLSNRNQINNA